MLECRFTDLQKKNHSGSCRRRKETTVMSLEVKQDKQTITKGTITRDLNLECF